MTTQAGTGSASLEPGVSTLHAVLQQTNPFVLTPQAFFVSWSGVLTLAFAGWPRQVVALKERLHSKLGNALRPENPGSLWPKITLGALREGRNPLSYEELVQLSKVCIELSQLLHEEGWALQVKSISQTMFVWPSHERLISRFDMHLLGELDSAEPDEEASSYVESVLKEGEDLQTYLPAVQKAGDISKYRTPCSGASLVAFASSSGPLPSSLVEFRARVEKALPGSYEWMVDDALHCTLRSLT